MAGKSGVRHPVAGTIRGAFLRALGDIENDTGMTFSQLMRREIEEHGLLTVMSHVGKFQEREAHVTGSVEHQHTLSRVSETIDFLEGVYSDRTDDTSEEPSETRPLLPH